MRYFDPQVKSARYRYSFSGSDAKVFAYFAGYPDSFVELDSMHTMSFSIHEAKGQARALGFRGVKGLARGVRTIAGSMIFTVIEDHPLRPLLDKYAEIYKTTNASPASWSVDVNRVGVGRLVNKFEFSNRFGTLLPPFNIMLQFVSEGARFLQEDPITGLPIRNIEDRRKSVIEGAGLLIEYIDLVDDGFVVSTNDIVTEVTYSFIAVDAKPLSRMEFFEGISNIPDLSQREHDALMQELRSIERENARLERLFYGRETGDALMDDARKALWPERDQKPDAFITDYEFPGR